MALFSKKKIEKEVSAPKTAKVEKTQEQAGGTGSMRDVLRAPRITEKASSLVQKNVVIFEVSPTATKREIIDAVKKSYQVTPRSVKIVAIPQKTVRHMRTGRVGVKSGGKKAYIYLKQGDSISIA